MVRRRRYAMVMQAKNVKNFSYDFASTHKQMFQQVIISATKINTRNPIISYGFWIFAQNISLVPLRAS